MNSRIPMHPALNGVVPVRVGHGDAAITNAAAIRPAAIGDYSRTRDHFAAAMPPTRPPGSENI